MAYFAAGIGCGWVSPILNRFKDSDSEEFSLSAEASSWIASIHYVGRGIGSILTAMLIDKVGRNQAFVWSAVFEFVIWIGVLASKSTWVHYTMRAVFGVGIGLFETAAPLYIGEISSPNFRAIFGGLCTIAFFGGEFLEFGIATYLSYSTIALINAVLTFAIIVSMLMLREPAHHLLAQGRGEEAQKRFFELRGHDEAAVKEFEETKQHFAEEKPTLTATLLSQKSVRAVTVVNCFVYLTGYPAINAMASLILLPTHGFNANQLTILLGLIQLVSVFISSAIIERIGRRPLLMVSALISLISHLAVATIFVFEERGTPLPNSAGMTFVFVTTYSVISAAVFSPISATIRGELLSPQLKPIGGCLAIVISSVVSMAMAGVFLTVAEIYGRQTNFLFYALMSATMLVYVYFDLPETKGLTLTEIQRSLRK